MAWSFIKGIHRLAKGKKDGRRWQAGMQYGIPSEQAILRKYDAKWECTFPWLLRDDTHDVRCCVGRARSQPCRRSASAPHAIVRCYPVFIIQMVNCQYRMSLFNCASLYAFCNKFQVKMYYNYCVIFRTTRFEAGPPNSQGWWFFFFVIIRHSFTIEDLVSAPNL